MGLGLGRGLEAGPRALWAAWVGTVAGDAQISGAARAEGHVIVLTEYRAGGRSLREVR